MFPLLPAAVLAVHAREIMALTIIKVFATIDHSPMGEALLQSARVQPKPLSVLMSLDRTIFGHVEVGVAQFATLSVISFVAAAVSYSVSGHYSFHQESELINPG